jgi:hypothetical protein
LGLWVFLKNKLFGWFPLCVPPRFEIPFDFIVLVFTF